MNFAATAARRVPILTWARRYEPRMLGGDALAGLVVIALAVPQALGYAGIAGVPVVVGIYAIPAALIAYAVFGSSPHLVVGPVSTVSVVSGSLVAELADGDTGRAIALTTALAIGSGIGLLAGGLLKLGWVAEFLSRPIVTGFVFGLVIVIIIGELPKLLGLPPTSGQTLEQAVAVLGSLPEADPLTAALGGTALAILFLGARFAPRIPWGLFVLAGSIALSSALDLASRGVAVVGEVPSGLPPVSLPAITPGDLAPVMFGGLAMALVGLAEGLSAARLFAAREGYAIDADQELIGAGAANVAAGLCGGLGVAGSLSKTAASRRAGGNTQMTGLLGAGMALVVLVVLAGALAPLPRTVLSAIVVQAVWGLMDVPALRRYQSVRRNDFSSAIAALIGVVLLGPLYGLLLAVLLSVLGLVYRSSRVEVEIMGKVPNEKAAWGSLENHPERRTYDGIVVIRLSSPLFWANAGPACDGVTAAVAGFDDVQVVLLDLEATSQLDTTSIDALDLLLQRLQERGIDLYLVRVFYQAREVLARAGFIERLGEDRMWHSITAGVRAARKDADPGVGEHTEGDLAQLAAGGERLALDGRQLGGYDDPDRFDRRPGRPWWKPF